MISRLPLFCFWLQVFPRLPPVVFFFALAAAVACLPELAAGSLLVTGGLFPLQVLIGVFHQFFPPSLPFLGICFTFSSSLWVEYKLLLLLYFRLGGNWRVSKLRQSSWGAYRSVQMYGESQDEKPYWPRGEGGLPQTKNRFPEEICSGEKVRSKNRNFSGGNHSPFLLVPSRLTITPLKTFKKLIS